MAGGGKGSAVESCNVIPIIPWSWMPVAQAVRQLGIQKAALPLVPICWAGRGRVIG